MDEMEFTLNSPLTDEDWDKINDAELEDTDEITFHTKHGRFVKFVKAQQEPNDKTVMLQKAYDDGYETGYLQGKFDSKPQWTPCSKRPPEEDGDYLVLYHTRSKSKPYVYDVMPFTNDLYQIDEYDFIDRRGQKGWFHYNREYGFCEDDSVYAWMPLPEPYKGEKND